MTTPDAPRRTSPAEHVRRARRFGPLLALVWIVFLSEPLSGALDAESTGLRVAGVAGIAGVAVIFGWTAWKIRTLRLTGRGIALLLGVQAAFVVPTALAARQSALVGLVFVGVTAIMLMRNARSLAVVAASMVVMLVLPRVIPGWEPEDSTALSAALSGLAIFAFTQLVERNRQLFLANEQVASLAAAEERERLARDVHDVVGHSLTVVSVKAELAARLVRADPDRAAAELADIQGLARSALADVRGMVAGERAVTLAGEIAGARAAFDAAGIDARLPGAVDVVPPERQELFAWTLREATTNVLRHSAARHAAVVLDADGITIDDDGRGLLAGAGGGGAGTGGSGEGGNGLTGLAARAREAGASLTTGRGALGGFRVAVQFAQPPSGQVTGQLAEPSGNGARS